MANTFELISSVTVGAGGAASIDFTSIPSTYTDLCVKYSLRTNYAASNADRIKLTFNGSSSAIYSSRDINAAGSGTPGSAARSGLGYFFAFEAGASTAATATSNTFSNSEIYIPNYAGSANKSYSSDGVTENNATAAEADLQAGLWASTAAINQITIVPYAGTLFNQYSTAYLYGISKN